jgi:hypothetical protein
VESAGRESMFFFFSGALKTYTNPWGRADTGDSHPIMNEWGGAGMVPSQVQVVWAIPVNLDDPQRFPTSSLPHSDQGFTGYSQDVYKLSSHLKLHKGSCCFQTVLSCWQN